MKNEIERRVERLEKKMAEMEKPNCIEMYYIDLIRECAQTEAQAAVEKILQHPIEMTIKDIENAFNHKIKIVDSH